MTEIATLLKAIVWDHAFGIRLPDDCKLAINQKKDNEITICRNGVIVNFFFFFFFFFDIAVFVLSSLVTGPSFMSISWLAMEFWQFSFLKDWPEIRKLEIPLSEFFSTKFRMNVSNKKIVNIAKCQGYSFYRFWVITRKSNGGEIPPPPPPRLALRHYSN